MRDGRQDGEEQPYWQIAEEHVPSKDNRAFQRLASEAAQVAKDRQIPRDEFRLGLQKLYEAYGDFLYAMNPTDTKSEDQRHWYNHFRDARLGKKMGEPPICQEI